MGPLGGKFDFFSPSGFEIQSDFDDRTSEIKFYSVRALKCYLNDPPSPGHSIVNNTAGAGSIAWGLGFWLGKDILGFFKNIDLDNS